MLEPPDRMLCGPYISRTVLCRAIGSKALSPATSELFRLRLNDLTTSRTIPSSHDSHPPSSSSIHPQSNYALFLRGLALVLCSLMIIPSGSSWRIQTVLFQLFPSVQQQQALSSIHLLQSPAQATSLGSRPQ